MDFEPLSQGVIDAAPDWMRAIPLRADGWRDENTRSVLATEAGAPVAVGMIWTSRVDGDRYWFEIAVDPAFRMRGHGRAMFSQLSSLRAVDKQTAPTVNDWSKDACAARSTFWRPAAWNAPSSTGT